MKYPAAILAAGVLALGAPAVAQVQEPAPDTKVQAEVQVVEKNARGLATKVKVGDKIYDVCMNDQQDDCINPRAAGLGWGDRPLAYWPGKPASLKGG